MQYFGIAFLNLLQMLSDDAGGLVQEFQIDFRKTIQFVAVKVEHRIELPADENRNHNF